MSEKQNPLTDERKQVLQVSDCRARIITLIAELLDIHPMQIDGFSIEIDNSEDPFPRLMIKGRYKAAYHELRPFNVILDSKWEVVEFTEIK